MADQEDVGFDDIVPMKKLPEERYNLVCPDCGAPMRLRPTGHYGKPFYGCTRWQVGCRANHQANADGSPVGVPANQETRKWRSLAHETFDRLWEGPEAKMTRHEAYLWLRAEGFRTIGQMSVVDCQKLVARLKQVWPEYRTAWDRLDSGPFADF